MSDRSALISGVVRDQRGSPIEQARVYFVQSPVPMPDIAALTDAGGRFTLSVPADGTYTIGCAAEGYAPTTVTTTISSGQTARLEVELME